MTTSTVNQGQQWLRIGADLKKDGVFFGLLGCVFGLIQFVGFEFFNQSNVGSELLIEHIPFKTIGVTVLVIFGVRVIAHLVWGESAPQSVEGMLSHIANRISALACVAAAVTWGFGVTAAAFGGGLTAMAIIIIACFFAALAELAVTPRLQDVQRPGVQLALGLAMAVPPVFGLLR